MTSKPLFYNFIFLIADCLLWNTWHYPYISFTLYYFSCTFFYKKNSIISIFFYILSLLLTGIYITQAMIGFLIAWIIKKKLTRHIKKHIIRDSIGILLCYYFLWLFPLSWFSPPIHTIKIFFGLFIISILISSILYEKHIR